MIYIYHILIQKAKTAAKKFLEYYWIMLDDKLVMV